MYGQDPQVIAPIGGAALGTTASTAGLFGLEIASQVVLVGVVLVALASLVTIVAVARHRIQKRRAH